MASNELKPVYVVDGIYFETKAEAQDYQRRPQIVAALRAALPAGEANEKIANWLVENREKVEVALETGKIKRVTKSENTALTKALDYIATTLAGDRQAAFVVDNVDAFKASFRWPSVKRMTDEEQSAAATAALTEVAEGNEKLAELVYANKDAILTSFDAGKPKREVSPQAAAGLEAYRQKMAAQKAEKEAAAEAQG